MVIVSSTLIFPAHGEVRLIGKASVPKFSFVKQLFRKRETAMVKNYRNVNTNVPQSEPLDSTQVKNNAGGFVYQVTPWQQLQRFLILGSEGNTYYVGEQKLTRENTQNLIACVAEDGKRVVDMAVAVSKEGRAPKNDPALFALAAAAKLGDEETRKYANAKVAEVARIGTHLLHYASFIEVFGGWGRGTVRSFQNWFKDQTPDQLAFQTVKYANRDGWTMRDLLRLTHPKPTSVQQTAVFQYIVKNEMGDHVPNILTGVEMIKQGEVNAKTSARLIREYNLPREVVPTQFLNDKEVWQALLDANMGITAMVRNLGKMTSIGLLDSNLSDATKQIVAALGNKEQLVKSRIHPLNVLVALKTYAQGRGEKGSLTWTPVRSIIDALDSAFYDTFQNVEPTGKNIMLALDVSGSMTQSINGLPLDCRTASAALALITANVEPNYELVGFTAQGRGYSSGNAITPLAISPKQRLDDVVRYMDKLNFGRTDCALPFLYAQSQNLKVDGFAVYTDNETWFGTVHPKVALQDYRNKSGVNAKSVVVAMTPTKFSIADPADAGMMDVVGFDTATPAVIADFFRG